MLVIRSRTILIIFLIGIVIIGFWQVYQLQRSRIRIGEQIIYLDPDAKINPEKQYQLSLWDYDLPLGEGKLAYRDYLKQALRNFQKIHPNIKVRLSLLDIMDGPARLKQALQANQAPDVYCSFYEIPAFDFRRQIPVGPFINKEMRSEYFSQLLAFGEIDGVLCSLPRWTAMGTWLGNSRLLEEVGIPVKQVQEQGWSWNDLLSYQSKLSKGKYLIVGNCGANGFFNQLLFGTQPSAVFGLLEKLVETKIIPQDSQANQLGRFLSGDTVMLAGNRPLLFRYLKTRLLSKKSGWEPVMLPVPSSGGNDKFWITENGMINVYRNRRTRGDDQIAAAVELAKFLSTYTDIRPWEELMVLPSGREAARKWVEAVAGMISRDDLNRLCRNSQWVNLTPFPEYQAKVYPTLLKLLQGKINALEAEREIQ